MPYRDLRYWLLPLLRLRLRRITGREHLPRGAGGYLIAANHNAWVDSPLMVSAVYRRLEKEMYFISRSQHYTSRGAIPIDPDNPRGVIPQCMEKLDAGHVVTAYPEGKSNSRPVLQPPRTGIARLAHLSGLPVVPVGIRGTFGISAPISIICFLMFWRPISFRFGPPLTFPKLAEADLTKELLEKTSAAIMRAISPLCGKPVNPELPSQT